MDFDSWIAANRAEVDKKNRAAARSGSEHEKAMLAGFVDSLGYLNYTVRGKQYRVLAKDAP